MAMSIADLMVGLIGLWALMTFIGQVSSPKDPLISCQVASALLLLFVLYCVYRWFSS
jgi:hypothetical protein